MMSENLLRLAILQRHGVEAGAVLDKVAIELTQPDGAIVRAMVHAFAVPSRRGAERCFAWAQASDPRTTIVHTAMQSAKIQAAAQAVRAGLARASRRQRAVDRAVMG